MATRRTRIKPVVNIPLGRRTENKPKDEFLNTTATAADAEVNTPLNDTPLSVDHSITKEVITIEHGNCKVAEKILEDTTVTDATISSKRVDNDVSTDTAESLAIQLTNDTSTPHRPTRRNLIKPKLNKKVLDNHKSLKRVIDTKEISHDSNILSSCAIQAKSLTTTDSILHNPGNTYKTNQNVLPVIENSRNARYKIRDLISKPFEQESCKTTREVPCSFNTLPNTITSFKHGHDITSNTVKSVASDLINDTCIVPSPTRRCLIKPKLNKNVLEKSKNNYKLSECTGDSKEILNNADSEIQSKSVETVKPTLDSTCTKTDQHALSMIENDNNVRHKIRFVSFTPSERNSCKTTQETAHDVDAALEVIPSPKRVQDDVTSDVVESLTVNSCTSRKSTIRKFIKPKLNQKALEKRRDNHKVLKNINTEEIGSDMNVASSCEIHVKSPLTTESIVHNPDSAHTSTEVFSVSKDDINEEHKIKSLVFTSTERDSCKITQKSVQDTDAATEVSTSPKHVHDVTLNAIESLAVNLIKDTSTQRKPRRSFIKPKLNKKVLEKRKELLKNSNMKEILNDTNTVSQCAIQIKSPSTVQNLDTQHVLLLTEGDKDAGHKIRHLPSTYSEHNVQEVDTGMEITTSPKRVNENVISDVIESFAVNLPNETCTSQKSARRSIVKPKLNKRALEKSKDNRKLPKSINSEEIINDTNIISSCEIDVKSPATAESTAHNPDSTCTNTEQHVFSVPEDDTNPECKIKSLVCTSTKHDSYEIMEKVAQDTDTVTTSPKHVHDITSNESFTNNLLNDTCTPSKSTRRNIIKPRLSKKALSKKTLEKDKNNHKLSKSLNMKEILYEAGTLSNCEVQVKSPGISQSSDGICTDTEQHNFSFIEDVNDRTSTLTEHSNSKITQKFVQDLSAVAGITTSNNQMDEDTLNEVPNLPYNLTNDKCTLQSSSSQSIIKPKLNEPVPGKNNDSQKSSKYIILNDTNTLSDYEIREKSLGTTESTDHLLEGTCINTKEVSSLMKNEKNPRLNIRRLPFKPILNPKLLSNLNKEQVVDLESSESDSNIECDKEKIVDPKDLTNSIKEVDSTNAEAVNSPLAKSTVNRDTLLEVNDLSNEGTKTQEDSESYIVGNIKSEEEDVETAAKQEALNGINHTTNIPNSSITRRRTLIRPVLSKKLLAKVESKVSISASELPDMNNVLNCFDNIPQQQFQDFSGQQTTSLDIMQADIVIPGAMVTDDINRVKNQEVVIPAGYSGSSEPEPLEFVNKTSNEPSVHFYKNSQQIMSPLGSSESEVIDTNSNESQKWYVVKNEDSVSSSDNDNVIAQHDIDCSNTTQIELQLKSQNDVKIVNITDVPDLHNDFINNERNSKIENDIFDDLEVQESNTKLTDIKQKPFRRIFSKPTLNKKILAQRKREYIENEDPKEEGSETKDVLNIARLPQEVSFDLQSDILQHSELEIATTNVQEGGDANLFVKPSVNLMVTNENDASQIIGNSYSNQQLELKYNAEQGTTPSPNSVRISRGRIKAVPHLGRSRVSSLYGSASESEDDVCRKRSRTTSASSTIGSHELNDNKMFDCVEDWKYGKGPTPRKCIRSEQSRKVAEARRIFIQKFGNKVPDKQKLTMMDLIYYNPCTEPMSQKTVKEEKIKEEKIKEEKVKAENVKKEEVKDETSQDSSQLQSSTESFESNKENEFATDDEGDGIPAPQIKIGINGEIIIDEKSLVIENAHTRISREQLQKSDLVDGDFDTGYGVFKRVKRTKEWSKPETMHFYKALNILGTDFSLMSQFFHNRSRRELKMKFKKEERHNLALVDKALLQHSHFDIAELRHDLKKLKLLLEPDPETAVVVKKTNEFLKISQKKTNLRRVTVLKKQRQFSNNSEDGIKSHFRLTGKEKERVEPPKLKRKYKPKNTKKRSAKCNIFKPTRSGRIPKQKHPLNSYEALIKHGKPKKNSTCGIKENQVSPGSIIVISCPSAAGEPLYKVFMVTGDQKQIPITLSDDVLNNLTESTHDSATFPSEDIKAEQLLAEPPNRSDRIVDNGNVKVLENESP